MVTPLVADSEGVRLSFSGEKSKMAFSEFKLKAQSLLDRRGFLQTLLDDELAVPGAAYLKANRAIFAELALQTTGDAYQLIEPLAFNGRAAWKALVDKYESASRERAFELHMKLFSSSMKHGEDPARLILMLEKTCQVLPSMGEVVSEDMLKAAAMRGLSADCDTVAVVVRSQSATSFDDMKAMVRNHYNVMQQQEAEQQQLVPMLEQRLYATP
jgi:gag-polypeptide of LTR copia-type